MNHKENRVRSVQEFIKGLNTVICIQKKTNKKVIFVCWFLFYFTMNSVAALKGFTI